MGKVKKNMSIISNHHPSIHPSISPLEPFFSLVLEACWSPAQHYLCECSKQTCFSSFNYYLYISQLIGIIPTLLFEKCTPWGLWLFSFQTFIVFARVHGFPPRNSPFSMTHSKIRSHSKLNIFSSFNSPWDQFLTFPQFPCSKNSTFKHIAYFHQQDSHIWDSQNYLLFFDTHAI